MENDLVLMNESKKCPNCGHCKLSANKVGVEEFKCINCCAIYLKV